MGGKNKRLGRVQGQGQIQSLAPRAPIIKITPTMIQSFHQSENELQLINGEFVATIRSSKNSKRLIKSLYEVGYPIMGKK
jgi:hypothetical protein